MTVRVDVQNAGSVDGDEVVQLYVNDEKASVDRPEKELKGFKRISLKGGEKKTVEFKLSDEAFAFWNEPTKKWLVEPGFFEIRVGGSSRDIRLKDSIKL